MASAMGLWNRTPASQWIVARSNDGTGTLLHLRPGSNKMIRLEGAEVVSAQIFSSQDAAESSLVGGERGKFGQWVKCLA